LYNLSMEVKYNTKPNMNWLQAISYECKLCGKMFLIKEQAEVCYDSHKK